MQVTCKTERSLLDHDDFEVVASSHHPAIYGLDREALIELAGRLRKLRDQAQTFARQRQREARGKAAGRGGSFPGTAAHAQARATVFTAALRRVDKELKRWRAVEARAANAAAARKALALRRAAAFAHHPVSEATAAADLRSIPSRRRRHRIPPSQIGRASQHNKLRQAIRDARNA